PADDARTPSARRDRNPIPMTEIHDRRDLLGVTGPGDRRCDRPHLTFGGPDHGQRPPVAACLDPCGSIHEDLSAPVAEGLEQGVVELDCGAGCSGGRLRGTTGYLDRWCG